MIRHRPLQLYPADKVLKCASRTLRGPIGKQRALTGMRRIYHKPNPLTYTMLAGKVNIILVQSILVQSILQIRYH